MASASPILLARPDYRPHTGSGHVFRLISLAECALREGWQVVFVTDTELLHAPLQHPALFWATLPTTELTPEDDAQQTLQCCQALCGVPALVMVDHYQLDERWEVVAGQAAPVLAIDDLRRQHHADSWVLDYFPKRETADYQQPADKLLLGAHYFLMRSSFRKTALSSKFVQPKPENLTILLQFGGAQIDRFALPVVRALHNCPEICGHINWLQGDASLLTFWQREDLTIEVLPHCEDMPALYANHDIALGAAGVAMWERLAVGLPSFVWQVVDNQRDNFFAAADYGLIHRASYAPKVSDQWLDELNAWLPLLTDAAPPALDTFGTNRVWRRICPNAFSLTQQMQFTPFSEDDFAALFALQTIPGIRQHSRHPEPPNWQQHQQWCYALLASNYALGWLVKGQGEQAIGWLKLDAADQQGFREVSLLIDPEYHAMGLGKAFLAFAKTQSSQLKAFVMDDNTASQRLFIACGFKQKAQWYFWQSREHDTAQQLIQQE